jgi:DNA-directed RNA polymerase-5 subunit 1
MHTWADKGAKMESDASDDNWENKSTNTVTSNKNDRWAKLENTWDKRKRDGGNDSCEKSDDGHGNCDHPSNQNGQNLNVDQDMWGNARGKNKADANCQWEEQPSTYKWKKTTAHHGIGRPNAKSNAGSSWGKKDKMESDAEGLPLCSHLQAQPAMPHRLAK